MPEKRAPAPSTRQTAQAGPTLASAPNAPENAFAKLCKGMAGAGTRSRSLAAGGASADESGTRRKRADKITRSLSAGGASVSEPGARSEGAVGLRPPRMVTSERAEVDTIRIPAKFAGLFRPWRYKVMYGGRGGAKSTTVADVLLTLSMERKLRILCARELQRSIKDSVHRLLVDRIQARSLDDVFTVTATALKAANGSEFFFAGLRHNATELKSFEGVDLCWVEEGQRVSADSWNILLPTIRRQGSEIWVTMNPVDDDDATYQRFIVNTPPGCLLINVNWDDNPWFPDTLNQERLYCLETDPEAYEWIWQGKTRKISDAVIFRGKFAIEAFDTPADARFFFGADWGFGPDPTVLVRCFEQGKTLYVDRESYAFGLDLDQIAATWRKAVPGCDTWQIYADNSQPQTINHVKGFGFRIGPAKKWPGSVEDGIKYLRGYEHIVVHERCYYTGQEMRLYSYKTDKITGEVLPLVVDKHNHCIDAIRYALDKRVKRRRGVF